MHKLGQHTDISQSEIMLPPATKLQLEYEQKIKACIEEQKKIDKYNTDIHIIDPIFDTKRYTGNTVIVRLFKNDRIDKSNIKDLDNIEDSEMINLIPVQKVEFESEGGKVDLIENPLNYKLSGIICAMSDLVKEKSKESIGVELNIGDQVEFNSVNELQMYYPDKTKVTGKVAANDVIRGTNPYPNFEGYFKTTPYNIESLIKPKT